MKKLNMTLAVILMLFAGANSYAQKVLVNDKNVAVSGYDVVAYFKVHDAVRGNIDHKVQHDGAEYYFSSHENAATFKTNPHKYLPVCGGYCAFGVAAKSSKFPADPKTFKIRDGKLYLFYNDYYEGKPLNTIIHWNENEASFVDKAAINWKQIK